MYYATLILNILPRLVTTLSDSTLGSVGLYLRFLLFLIIKKLIKNNVGWKFVLLFESKKFEIRLFDGSPDIAALTEIFLDKEYEWKLIKDPKIIIDLGAHTGNTALYFHLKYPEATIYAVEASPKNYERLTINVRNISKIKPVYGAVSDIDGVMTFFESKSSLGSSLYQREETSVEIDVPSFTLETFFRKNALTKADFIKVDIEGSEEKLFTRTSPEAFSRSYIIEVHDDLMHLTRAEFVRKFNKFTVDYKEISNVQRILLRAFF